MEIFLCLLRGRGSNDPGGGIIITQVQGGLESHLPTTRGLRHSCDNLLRGARVALPQLQFRKLHVEPGSDLRHARHRFRNKLLAFAVAAHQPVHLAGPADNIRVARIEFVRFAHTQREILPSGFGGDRSGPR